MVAAAKSHDEILATAGALEAPENGVPPFTSFTEVVYQEMKKN